MLILISLGLSTASGSLKGQEQTAEEEGIRTLVSRLSLENYKATLKGLTQFGDRRQGTQRNRDAVDWIEAQLQIFGCTNTDRIVYVYPPPPLLTKLLDQDRLKGVGGDRRWLMEI